eukprot:2504920-Pyramimonas_sp.AAC.1
MPRGHRPTGGTPWSLLSSEMFCQERGRGRDDSHAGEYLLTGGPNRTRCEATSHCAICCVTW